MTGAGTDVELDDFETRLRAELRRRADGLELSDIRPGFVPRDRPRRSALTGVTVAAALVAIALVAATMTHEVGRGRTNLGSSSTVSTTPASGAALGHLTIAGTGIQLRAAQDLPARSSGPGATFSAVSYRAPGPLRPPILQATLARASDQPLPSDPRHHPQYRAIDVDGRAGEIVWLGRDVADLVVQVDDAHTLDLGAWGFTESGLVTIASSVVVHSDTSFELSKLPARLQPGDADPSTSGEGARAEFSTKGGPVVLTQYAGSLAAVLGDLLYPGSGTRLGSTTIDSVTVDGARGLLRVDERAGFGGSADSRRLSFHAVWGTADRTGAISGGAASTAAIAAVLRGVAPVDDATWRGMVARCPWPVDAKSDNPTTC